MKVARVRWTTYRVPFIAPYETAHGSATHRTGVIVQLETNEGVAGYGEATLDPSEPENATQAILPHVEAMARDLAGKDANDLDATLEPYSLGDYASRAAHCAVDTALTDAGARTAGRPIAELLGAHFSHGIDDDPTGPPFRDAITVNATIAARSTVDAAAQALAALASGFSCVKLKVGMERSLEDEVERVKTIREVIGPDVKLRLDANGAWDEATAIATIDAMAQFDIELIEQPVPADDIEALGHVHSAVVTPIAADEAVTDFDTVSKLVDYCDALVLKPIRLGGLTVTRYIAQYAQASGRDVIVTSTIDTGIGIATALQVAASILNADRAHGLATASLLESDLLEQPLMVERGIMRLPTASGLGVTLDDDALARYTDGWHEAR